MDTLSIPRFEVQSLSIGISMQHHCSNGDLHERARLLELEARRMKAEIRREELREQMMSLSIEEEAQRRAMDMAAELRRQKEEADRK